MSHKSASFLAAALALASLGLAAPARADDYAWGAIAIDLTQQTKDPSWGVGGGGSEGEAVENATKFCREAGGKAGCKIVVTYRQCGAFASNGREAGWGKAPTKMDAENSALKTCGQNNCSVVTSDCN